MNNKHYIGDGVYVEIEPWGDVVLTTENGISTTNRIVLEPEVLKEFELYIEQWLQS
jgi:hypothetical protein